MSLKDKAARLNLSDLDNDLTVAAPATEPSAASAGEVEQGAQAQKSAADLLSGSAPALARRARSGMGAISERIGAHHQLQDLQQKVAEYEASGVIVKLSPQSVRENKWKNRHPLSFKSDSYLELKTEIEGAGGNVQPIKVRRLPEPDSDGCEYEIVYGRRRLRACLELGLPVNAIVETMDDAQAFQAMERENRNREDLSPWEQGVMYQDAIAQGLFSSQRQMSAALGVPQGTLSKAIQLASLPDEIVDAFPSPLELQFRWGADIAEAMQRDPAKVLAIAEKLRNQEPKLASKEVYAHLLGVTTVGESSSAREFHVGGKRAANWVKDAKGNGSLKIKSTALTPAKEKKLMEFLERLLE